MLMLGSLCLVPLYSSHETKQSNAMLIDSYKIWDSADHNAFTDLTRYNNKWFCTFRESDSHVKGQNGQIRILQSEDGIKWTSTSLITESGIDLRDPKLSVTPDNQLMLLVGGSVFTPSTDKYIPQQSYVSFSKDGQNWNGLIPVLTAHEWLWRVTWHQGTGYGVAYNSMEKEWTAKLYKTLDGINYEFVTQLQIPGRPSEATIQFDDMGEMLLLIRRGDPKDNHAWFGKSMPPYTDWKWLPTPYFLGGPNFVITPHHDLWAAGRIYDEKSPENGVKTGVFELFAEDPKILYLPSAKDSGYPGMYFYKDVLWITYYSSHEDKTAIYLAKVKLN